MPYLKGSDKLRAKLELTPTYAAQLDGKVLTNAHAVGDVDGDGATELLFGSLLGKVSVFKIVGDRLTQWKSCEVNGSVTAICLDDSFAGDTRIIVATAEGTCSVFRSVEGAEVLQLCFEFSVALNICDVVHVNGELIIATRDGRLLVYQPTTGNLNRVDPDLLSEYSQVAQMEINDEIETLIIPQQNSPQLLARCFSGDVFSIGGPTADPPIDKRKIAPWDGPPTGNDGITFVVCDIALAGERGMNALVSMNGLVSLFSASGERQWDFQLPEALVNADKLEMTAPGGDRQDAIVVCTWSGQMYAIQSERRLVRFRMLLPGCSMFCVGIHDFSVQVDPTIVGISTSGTVFVYRDVQETLIRGLQDSTLSDKVKESSVFAQMDTPEKRKELMKKLHKAFPQQIYSTGATVPSVQDLIKTMVAVQL
ncbi:KICSTOR complex protein ITFG2 [Phytophthora citrophthora]|uniref:KICSTOR complex protein ITFG2 n=1 Tax=Phytophthora citrophthora TaxID=4793 RepID=A0AAD9L9V9_9STRA|nr:KICSTOR complex protein ITFG2 [Phytophthora citrophthora]